MGAKNHGVVMPDANKENALNQLCGAAFGAAGQRCMALSTAIFVGEAKEWIPEFVERAKALKGRGREMEESFGQRGSGMISKISKLFPRAKEANGNLTRN